MQHTHIIYIIYVTKSFQYYVQNGVAKFPRQFYTYILQMANFVNNFAFWMYDVGLSKI